MFTDDSTAVADVSSTVGVLQPTLLRETRVTKTQRIRLDDNSFENTRSLLENSVTAIDLKLSYNVKYDICDNQLLCLIVRLLCLSI